MKKIRTGILLSALVAGFAFVMGNYLPEKSGGKVAKKSKKIAVDAAFSRHNIIPIVIIGSGPAGLSAAIYAARSGMHAVIIQGSMPGGLLTQTSAVENYPGYTSVLGPELMATMQEQAKQLGAQPLADSVAEFDFSSWPYRLTTDEGLELNALSVILATGAAPRRLGVPGESIYWGTGVTSCAVCDAPFFKGEEVVVVGGGDSAVEEAIQLYPYAKKITILVRKGVMRAASSMQGRLKGYPSVSIMYNVEIKKIVGDDMKVTGLELYNSKDKTSSLLPASGVFLAIGHDPNTALFKPQIKTDEHGYIKLKGRSQRTSVRGVFAAGDVEDPTYRQAGVAAGSGIKAALGAFDFLGDIGLTANVIEELTSRFFQVDARGQAGSVRTVTTPDEFNALVKSTKGPVIVDFYADYCPSCMQMLPFFQEVAGEYAGKATFVKVDVDQAPEIAEVLQVQKIPTLLVYKDGELAARHLNAMTKKELGDFVNGFLREN